MEEFGLLTLIISVLAIIISIIGMIFSKSSNNKSNNIQELQSRPWLIATVHKNDDSGCFYDIIEKNGSIYWQAEINIENKGATPANNIRIPNNVNLKDIKTIDTDLSFHLENIVLGQGQKYRYNFKVGGQPKNPDDLQSLLAQYKSNNKGLVFKFKVFYRGLVNPNKEYTSEYTFDIKSDKFTILNNSEYK